MKTIYLIFLIITACTGHLYCIQEVPLVVIVPAYNNAAYVRATLSSIASQEYTNYRVIYIDDGSTDGGPAIVEECIQKYGWHEKMTFIKNEQRYRKLRNVYYAIHYLCSDEEIVVFVDCDDLLAHPKVFKKINRYFQNPNTWFMYGNDKAYPLELVKKLGISQDSLSAPTPKEVIFKNSFRKHQFVYMHIRAFRAWLYKQIKIEDLLADGVPPYQGKFYPACNDYANIFPMVEMAGHHLIFNPELVYLYNAGSPINGFKIDKSLQINSANEIKQRKPYQPLSAAIFDRLASCQQAKITMIIVAHNTAQVDAQLRNYASLVSNCHHYAIMYTAADEQEHHAFEHLQAQWPDCQWLPAEHAAAIKMNDYCCLIQQPILFQESIDLLYGICELERTMALAAHYDLRGVRETLRIQPVHEHMDACMYKHNPAALGCIFDAILLRSDQLNPVLLTRLAEQQSFFSILKNKPAPLAAGIIIH